MKISYHSPMVEHLRLGYCVALILTLLILVACDPPSRELTVVTGKTVYGDLALEGVRIEVSRWEHSRWRYFSDTKSGYHGSFRVHLPTGTYILKTSTLIRMGDTDIALSGTLENLVVKEVGGRMDQIVIEMDPDVGSGQ